MYTLDPRYAPAPEAVLITGWQDVASHIPRAGAVVAVDGPPTVDWTGLRAQLEQQLSVRETCITFLDMRIHYAAPADVRRRTERAEDAGDPYFCKLAENLLDDCFNSLPPAEPPPGGVLIVYGPGAALVRHDLLWYADVPKRYAEGAATAGHTGVNLGLPHERADLRRLFYIDWPMLDRHRDTLAHRFDAWLDLQEPDYPTMIDGAGLRATCAALARHPVRTRPYFNSTPWGGHWAQRKLGFNTNARNTALGYELIAPEAGVLVGTSAHDQVEVPFQLLCVLEPMNMLGPQVHARFGTSFPIRFDYLDTVGGGNLSVHCHPKETYMRERFGWPYTQHETYYVTLADTDAKVFLGLREDADPEIFRKQVQESSTDGVHLDPEDHVLAFPSEPGQLFMIPAGTPHASGAGNLVLEISATPYLYSLRFYDWLRPGANGKPRPLPYEHGFANLETGRRGTRVARDLVQAPRTLRSGDGWREEVIGALEEMFYEVRRHVIAAGAEATDDTQETFHILNVVEGEGVMIETAAGDRHELAYAETLTLPAAVGHYTLRAIGGPVRVVKALVR
ncbi:class I mannose-6-phosphate isomerase (plasmid) [Streptomyces sp. AHU1]|uniref:class I mannose-6-phosphate isomerase n=1 Tax=Streptomyces sp. AHU1 TaxID=3377215 RepID=UPI003877E513